MNDAALVFEGVTRAFGSTLALDRVSLQIETGSVAAILGRNGAGKTTTLRLAHGLLWPDAGRIRTLGLDPAVDGRAVRTRVSLLADESSLYPWMTVEEVLTFGGALHPRWDASLAASLSKRLELDPRARVSSLSRGTRAKVALVLAVAPRPDLLLLDDPTAGLDPLVRREVLEGILDGVPEQGGAVVYASHLVHDVERIADRVIVMDGGSILVDRKLEDLKSSIRRARAVFEDDAPASAQVPGSIDVQADGRVLSVVASGVNGDLEASLRCLGARQVEVQSLSLEEILVALLRRGRTATSEVDR